MNAYYASDAEILALAAKSLGDTDNIRRTIQCVYDLGRASGRVEQVKATSKHIAGTWGGEGQLPAPKPDAALGAEACVTRHGVPA